MTEKQSLGFENWLTNRKGGGVIVFILKQLWAALFGCVFLAAILLSKAIWQPDWALARYDGLVIFAVVTQILMVVFRLETKTEVKVIILFHITGTVMEFFKVGAGSWAYPEDSVLKILGVPLFTGFMYGTVGSYIARAIRIFNIRFASYPPLGVSFFLAGAIYVNFFAHHYVYDFRWVLIALTVLIYGRCRVWFHVGNQAMWAPFPIAVLMAAFGLWVAENVGTYSKTWIYAGQLNGELVSFSKMGSWYLLIYVAFATVTLVQRQALEIRSKKDVVP